MAPGSPPRYPRSMLTPVRAWLWFAVAGLLTAAAQNLPPPGFRPLPPGTHALVGARVFTQPDTSFSNATVVIRDGRIVEAGIASCETRYPCDVIGDIIAQPVARQSPEVDRVSRATESADAYYYGLVEALKEALMEPVQVAAPQ